MTRVLARNSITLSFERDIVSVVRYYKLQASTAAAPTKPDANAALPSGWVSTEQTYIEGSTNSLYTLEKTTFTDGTWDYSDVSLSSSYEAAKVAYNRAVAAQDSVDNIEVGGRNLILNTAQERVSPASASNSAYVAPAPTLSAYGSSILNNTTDWFTYSFDYEVTGNEATGAYVYAQIRGSQIATGSAGLQSNVYDTPVGKYCCTFHLTSTQATGTSLSAGIRLRNATDGAILTVRNIKLERGNKPTDWSPAPEDIVAESVSSVQVGGRNLYAVCDESEGYVNTSGIIIDASDGNERTSPYIPVSEGERYVLQSWVPSITSDNRSWIAYQFYSNNTGTVVGSRAAKYSAYGGTYLCYDDIVVPSGASYLRVSYRKYDDGYCKLEIGNKPTDWTPAPEDVSRYTDDSVGAIEVGGRNLARGTGDTTEDNHWAKTRATESNGVLTITPTTSAAYGKYKMDYLLYGDNVNQIFTVSFDAREIESESDYGSGNIVIYFGIQSPSRVNSILLAANDGYASKKVSVTGEGWNRYSASFSVPSEITSGQASALTDDAIMSFQIGRSARTCPIEVKRCKLERGNKATDWTPAPEDVTKYTDDLVDAIEIGGRNLLLNSDGQANKSVTAYTIGSFNFSEALIEGEEYTVRAYITTTDRTGIAFYHSGGTYQMGSDWIPINESNLYSVTFTATANMASQTSGVGYGHCNVYATPNSGGGACTIKWIKVEKGNKATDWTPAPEDVDARIKGLNLSPFFSYTPFAVGDYWRFISSSSIFTFTPVNDGWIRVQADNSSGSSYVQFNIMPYNDSAIKPGTDYTFLFEFRNNASTGSSTNSDVYIVQASNIQFWGSGIKTLLSGVGSNTSTNVISQFVPGAQGIYEKRFVKTSEPADSEYWTGTVNSLVYLRFRCAAGGTQDYEVRVSIYEGEYTGPYKPYNVDVGDFAKVKTTANGKNKVVYSTTTPSGTFTEGDTWFNTSTTGNDAGKISKWNGSSWVVQEIGSASILANEALMNKIFAYDVTAANKITAPVLVDDDYDGTIDTSGNTTTYDIDNEHGSIINLREGTMNIGNNLIYDPTNGLVLNGNLTATSGIITGATLSGSTISGEFLEIDADKTTEIDITPTHGQTYDGQLSVNSYIHTSEDPESIYNESELMIGKVISFDDPLDSSNNKEEACSISMKTYVTAPVSWSYSLHSQIELSATDNINLTAGLVWTYSGVISDTYTSFSGNVVSDGSISIVQKNGWCQVFGYLTLSGSVSDWTELLSAPILPAPQHGINIINTAARWGTSYERGLRIRVAGTGGLAVRYGSANEYRFDFCYPIEQPFSLLPL